MDSPILVCLLFAITILSVDANSEGDALYAWKIKLVDPNNVLQSWDPTLVNPCTWYHVTCNFENSVIRVDLGDAGLSGPLVPALVNLTNLQYLQVAGNKIYGPIPSELGNLTSLVSLGLNHNKLTGPIPASLGYLTSLRFLNLNSNQLNGTIPTEFFHLIHVGNLRLLNVSDNLLEGSVASTNSTGFAVTTIIQDPKAMMM